MTDEAIASYKNIPYLDYKRRKIIVQNIKYVKKVIPQNTLDYVKNLILLNQLKAVQLHGKETPKYCNEIQKLNVEVIKVFNINQNFNFSKLSLYEKFCDYYLFDTKYLLIDLLRPFDSRMRLHHWQWP